MTIIPSNPHSGLGMSLAMKMSKVFLELNSSLLLVLESHLRMPSLHNPTHLCRAMLSRNQQVHRPPSRGILCRTRTTATLKANSSMATGLTTLNRSSTPLCSRHPLDLGQRRVLWRSNLQVSLSSLRPTPIARDCIPKVDTTITNNTPTISNISNTNTRIV